MVKLNIYKTYTFHFPQRHVNDFVQHKANVTNRYFMPSRNAFYKAIIQQYCKLIAGL